MFFNLGLLFTLCGKVRCLFGVCGGLTGIVLLFSVIGWIVSLIDEDEGGVEIGKKASKISTWVFIPCLLLAIFTPSKREVLTLASLRAVDAGVESVEDYTADTPDSMLSTDGVLSLVDDTLRKVDDFLKERD